LLVTPFTSSLRRASAESAALRNQLLAQFADEVLIAYAQPGSKTETLAAQIAGKQPFFTLRYAGNEKLIELGASVLDR
jgi:hypothetical protein